MNYQHVCIESFGFTLPDEILTSDDIECRLAPLYRRLRLPEGRLELMTGIREHRLWKRGTLPSSKSVQSGRHAVDVAEFDPRRIGALVHGSVCRDHLEPATSCRVHHELGLSKRCMIYDVSNACLGLLNGMVQVANMIELGQIEAGLVVGTEGSRQLVETTIDMLNRDESLSRRDLKLAIASLTIGSGSVAILLTHRSISNTDNRLLTASVQTYTNFHQLCHSGQDEAGQGMRPWMQTDSEQLMHEGIHAGKETFDQFLKDGGWARKDLDRTFCHQVGTAHRKLMLEALGLPIDRDFATLQWLGNTGSVALPITMAIALDQDFVQPGNNIGMLGIGSGINCLMLGANWQKSLIGTDSDLAVQVMESHPRDAIPAASARG